MAGAEVVSHNMTDTRQVTIIILGVGQRGKGYSNYAIDFPDKLKVVGVAEPRKFHRESFQKAHGIPDDRVFTDWREILELPKFADAVAICTPDQLHREPAVQAARKKYHILLEKPMDVSVEGCREIVQSCEDNHVTMAVCHVLRYYPPNKVIKDLISQGVIGDVVNIQHLEPVGFYHFAHSFVRGNWHKEKDSTFCLLAKCCHDLDLICYWLEGSQCSRVSSFGSLIHFNKESRPPGAASRCVDCAVEDNCPYSALKIYLKPAQEGNYHSFLRVMSKTQDIESVVEALKTGPYGRCVYDCDNDVVSHQVVNMEFDKGQTASLTMVAFSKDICKRNTKVFGTRGQITYDGDSVWLFDFLSQTNKEVSTDFRPKVKTRLLGHNGADFYLMDAFVKSIASNDPSLVICSPEKMLESHLIAFAAEKSRKTGTVVDFPNFVDGTNV